MTPPIPPEASKEIEQVKALVARHFPVYDVRVAYDVVEFFVKTDPTTLEDNFEQMRADMAQQGYIPMITYDKGEHVVTVAKKPATRFRSIWVNLIMLAITFFAMVIAGALNWAGYSGIPSNEIFAPSTIAMGILVFTLPLMAIIGVHELAHFLMARRRHVAASLPFFLPSIPPLGTFGAFISLREPIPNKKVLLEVGVAGPLAGLALAIPIGILGLILTNDGAKLAPQNVSSGGEMSVMFPLIYLGIEQLIPITGPYLLHPMAFAAWVGFLVTALNLLPMGQLDGGHVARALLGSKAKYLTYATVAAMIGFGFFYLSWFLFAALVLFLGLRHPPPLNDITKLDTKRKAVGVIAFIVLIISFVPIPLVAVAADYSFEVTTVDGTNATIAPDEVHLFQAVVNNSGNSMNLIDFTVQSAPFGWSVAFKQPLQNDSAYSSQYEIALNASQNKTIDVLVRAPATAAFASNSTIEVKAASVNDTAKTHVVSYNLTIVSPRLEFWVQNNNTIIPRGTWGEITVQVNNTGPMDSNLTLNATGQSSFVDALIAYGAVNSTGPVNLTVPGSGNVTFRVVVYVSPPATIGEKTVFVNVEFQKALVTVLDIKVDVI